MGRSKHVSVDMWSELSHWALWRTMMRSEYFFFVDTRQEFWQSSAPRVFSALVTSISCSLLVNPDSNDSSWEGRNTCLWIYLLNLSIEISEEYWWEQNIFCSFTTPQAIWQSLAPGALTTLVTSVTLYWLTQIILISPGKDKTRVCGYTLWISSLNTLENTDENITFSVRSPPVCQSLAPGALSTLVTSVVFYSLRRAALILPGKDETSVVGYKL